MGITWAAGRSTFASVAAAALLATGLAACSVETGGSAASPVKTVIATAAASHDNGNSAAASHDSGSSAGATASSTAKLPDYRPATVVSESSTTTVLKSPDSVAKVGDFYKSVLASGGWDTTSASTGPFHASFTAHRAHEGVSISVYPRFGGSGISISQYPV
jgi:hypothetical protein